MNTSLPDYETGGPHPKNFGYNPACRLNQQAQLIPDNACIDWSPVPAPPSTVKHLYSPKPADYDPRMINKPVGTLYNHQFVETWPTGMGQQKVIGGGHYKVYPLTNRHVNESRDYTPYYFPRPLWGTQISREIVTTSNHVKSEGWW